MGESVEKVREYTAREAYEVVYSRLRLGRRWIKDGNYPILKTYVMMAAGTFRRERPREFEAAQRSLAMREKEMGGEWRLLHRCLELYVLYRREQLVAELFKGGVPAVELMVWRRWMRASWRTSRGVREGK